MAPNCPDWLFIQNRLDRRRVSGQLIDHYEEVILQYHGAELFDFGIVHGWKDVITFGAASVDLERMRSTGRSGTFGGEAFDQYVSVSESGSPSESEIRWSPTESPPLRIIRQKGTTTGLRRSSPSRRKWMRAC